ncbi:hypothetical protein GPJ56_002332 [Histomonas meleagridis]|uniref:uncharacterized protein n=1 Tax=Histomonas meleagridis TaxID=135588 RepID=UPI00355A053E|nr:hypothetical protein GPJ56_002332 [Histomonas meleagridis]KAH0804593.1 hypothetical protein GO595_003423 [Histomonas meleagridis]
MFFLNSINPAITRFFSYAEDRALKYVKRDNRLERYQYWNQVAQFCQKIVQRMISGIPLLPTSARRLVTALLELDPTYDEFKYIIIVETFICRYITSYIDAQDPILMKDAAQYLLCCCPMDNPFKNRIKDIIQSNSIDFKPLFDALILKKTVSDGLSDAIDIAGRFTLITPRDLTLLIRGVRHFQEYVGPDNQNVLSGILNGIDEPKEANDTVAILLRVLPRDSTLDNVQLKPMQPYEEMVDLLNLIDLNNSDYNTPEELQSIMTTNCSLFMTPLTRQKISIEVLSDCSRILSNTTENRRTLSILSERLSTALFVVSNETNHRRTHLSTLIEIITKRKIIPSLIDEYPYEFIYNYEDIFSPLASYTRLIETASKRIESLNLMKENQVVLQRSFFINFVDQIDIAFSFQSKVKTERIPKILSSYCQSHSEVANEADAHRQAIIGESSIELQYIKNTHRISYNLKIALRALRKLSIFNDEMIALAIAISGNAQIFGFVYFLNSYLRDKRIKDVLMNEQEQAMIEKFRKATQMLHALTEEKQS